MTSLKTVVLLLLSLGLLPSLVSAAFSVSDYFYPDETEVTVEYQNFTLDDSSYSIITFDGKEAFLLENDQVVTEQSRLDTILHDYYMETYYPSDDELESLKELVLRFNKSRNDGYDYKNKEEYTCRDDAFYNGKLSLFGTRSQLEVYGTPVSCTDSSCTTKLECRNNVSCTRLALLLVGQYCEPASLCSGTDALNYLTSFSLASYGMDEIITNITTRLDDMTESNVADTIRYIKTNAPILKNYSLNIENTLFRRPRLNDSADRKACQGKCFGFCPSMELDQESLDTLKEEADELYTETSSLSKYIDVSTAIRTNTAARMEGHRIANLTAQYWAKFEPINASGKEAIALGADTITHVRNTTLSRKLDTLRSLHVTIPVDIEAHNFTTVDADLVTYQALITEVKNISAGLIEIYNRTHSAKKTAHAMIFIIETKDLDPVSLKTLGFLKNETEDVDASFQEGLMLSQLGELEEKYNNITARAKELFKSGADIPASRAMTLFRGFARRLNTGLANAAVELGVIPKQEIPQGVLPLGTFSALIFIAFASVLFLFFLSLLSLFRFIIPKTTHILVSAFLCMVVLLLGFSTFTYLLLDKTATDATLPEFLADLEFHNSTAIMVDLRGGSLSDATMMRSCAFALADSIATKNKSWAVYAVSDSQCTTTNSNGVNITTTAADCVSTVNRADSAFVLAYSQVNEAPKFAVVYQNRADMRGNVDYYESCPFATLFS